MLDLTFVSAISLFKTEQFRVCPYVQGVCRSIQQVADRPGHVWVTRDAMPDGHFTNYCGALTERAYGGNAIFADLYYLHELRHVGTFGYNPQDSPLNWIRRFIRSEFEASFASEVLIYLKIPGLRRKEFPFNHEIWIDRFLKDELLMSQDPGAIEAKLRAKRERALTTPTYDDFIEHQFHNYFGQNMKWCGIWQGEVGYGPYARFPAYAVVEKHMADMRLLPFAEADKAHRAWLATVTPKSGKTRVPFREQALAFKQVYDESNLHFGNWRLRPLIELPS